MKAGLDRRQVEASSPWQGRCAGATRLVIAPLVLFSSGFFTADFLLSGLYTWPRTGRILVLSLTILVLAYEFVYKEERGRHPDSRDHRALKGLVYYCVIPYGIGGLVLLALARLAR
ncbi:MAG: hypothetical protein ACREIS_14515 [Nitrospiraceae bacterium]